MGSEISEMAGYASRLHEMHETMSKLEKKARQIVGTIVIEPIRQSSIIFRNVTIYTPTFECLVKDLSIEIKKGQHTLIMGPSGCGKFTAIFIYFKVNHPFYVFYVDYGNKKKELCWLLQIVFLFLKNHTQTLVLFEIKLYIHPVDQIQFQIKNV